MFILNKRKLMHVNMKAFMILFFAFINISILYSEKHITYHKKKDTV